MPLRILLFAEAQADARTVEALIDRTLAECEDAPSWVIDALETIEVDPSRAQVESRAAVRVYFSETLEAKSEAGSAFADVHHLVDFAKTFAGRRGFRRSRGHFDGKPGMAAAKLGRKAFDVAEQARRCCGVDAAVVVVDMDTEPSRCCGLKQARRTAQQRVPDMKLVVGCPNQCREAWVLASFDPSDAAETERLAECREALGFDPRAFSERLHHDHKRKYGADACLRRLTKGDRLREQRSLRTSPLETLRQRGRENGLASFLAEVTSRLCPLVR